MKKNHKEKNFAKFSQASKNHPKAKILQQAQNQNLVLKNWPKAIDQFFQGAAEQTRALSLKNGELFVACLSKELAYKIKLFARRIIYLINKLIGRELVYNLQVEY